MALFTIGLILLISSSSSLAQTLQPPIEFSPGAGFGTNGSQRQTPFGSTQSGVGFTQNPLLQSFGPNRFQGNGFQQFGNNPLLGIPNNNRFPSPNQFNGLNPQPTFIDNSVFSDDPLVLPSVLGPPRFRNLGPSSHVLTSILNLDSDRITPVLQPNFRGTAFNGVPPQSSLFPGSFSSQPFNPLFPPQFNGNSFQTNTIGGNPFISRLNNNFLRRSFGEVSNF